VKKKSLLDSFAILAWIQDEKGAQQVEDLLYLAQDHKEELLLNIITLGEVFFVVLGFGISLLPEISLKN